MQGVGGFYGRQDASSRGGIADGNKRAMQKMEKWNMFATEVVNQEVDMAKVEIEVLKPWI